MKSKILKFLLSLINTKSLVDALRSRGEVYDVVMTDDMYQEHYERHGL